MHHLYKLERQGRLSNGYWRRRESLLSHSADRIGFARIKYLCRLTYLYGPAVCCKPDVSDREIGLALLYPARE